MNADTIIEAGAVLCSDERGGTRVEHDAAIIVGGGRILQIGPADAVRSGNEGVTRHGGPGFIAMAGLVNAHHHFGLTPLMMGVPFAPLELWLPRFRAMRQIGARLDTLYSAIEMLESGTTTVHHIHGGLVGDPKNWALTADETLSAYREIGMRAGFSFMMRDRNVLAYEDDAAVLGDAPEDVRDWIVLQLAPASVPTRDYMAFFTETRQRWATRAPDTVRINLAPANLHWCSDESLQLVTDTARASGACVHMHLLETERQARFAYRRLGRSAVEHLAILGILGPELTLGHGNWASPDDIDRLAEHGCTVCHNASSGLRLGSGIAPVNAMRARGIPVALGIDQSNIADNRDMLLEMKLVWALHRGRGFWDDRPGAAEVLRMAGEHGARSAGYGEAVGRLAPGYRADVVLLSREAVERPVVNPRTPLADIVLHRAEKESVEKVFVEGELVVDGGRVVRIDRDAVMAEIKARLAIPETPCEAKRWALVGQLIQHLERFHRAFPV